MQPSMPWIRRLPLMLALVLSGSPVMAQPAQTETHGMDLLNVPALQSEQSANALLLDVTMAGSRLVAVGERGIILTSDDAAASWQQVHVPVSVTLTSVYFATPHTGWAAGHDGVVLKSSDAGVSWRRVLDGNRINDLILADLRERLEQFEQQMDPDDSEAAEQLELLQIRLEDAEAGASFGPARPLLDLWFVDASRGFAIGAFGQLLGTHDGGETWESVGGRMDNPDSLHLNAINHIPGKGLVIAGERGMVWISPDGGESWRSHDTGYHGNLYGVMSPGGDALLAYGFAGHLFLSEDGGDGWQALPRTIESALIGHVVLGENRFALASRDGYLLSSDDGGLSFSAPRRIAHRATASALPLALQQRHIVIAGRGGISTLDLSAAATELQ